MPSNLRRWTAIEDNILLVDGPGSSMERLEELIPGRTAVAIRSRLHKLGIKRVHSNSYLNIEYTEKEDDLLRLWFKLIGAQAIKERYLPARSLASIYSRAQRIGLTCRKSCMLPPDDLSLVMALYIDPDLSVTEIAKKFELDPSVCQQICRRTIDVWFETKRISEQTYYRTMVLRVLKAKDRVIYLDKLIELTQKRCYGMEAVEC